MLAGVGFEQSPKIRTARGQHHLVCCKRAAITCEGNIDEILLIFQTSKRGQNRRVEVVPAQRVLLLWGGIAPHWAKRGGNLYANGWTVRWRSVLFWSVDYYSCCPWFSRYVLRIYLRCSSGGDFDNLINSIFGPGRSAYWEKVSGFPQVKIGRCHLLLLVLFFILIRSSCFPWNGGKEKGDEFYYQHCSIIIAWYTPVEGNPPENYLNLW